jgi:integrase
MERRGKAYMSIAAARLGTENAASVRDSSTHVVYQRRELLTLQDLVDRLRDDRNAKMFRSAANKFAEYQSQACNEVHINALESDCGEFRDFLRERKYAKNSVRSYSNYISMLLNAARTLGWTPTVAPILPSWEPVAKAMRESATKMLIRHLAKKGYEPSAVQESDLAEWTNARVKNGWSYGYSKSSANELRKHLIQNGLNSRLSAKRVAKPNYGIRLDQMPKQLRSEIEDVLRWKQDTFVAGRPAKAHVRAISANNLEAALRRLVGYCINVLGRHDVTSMSEVVTEPMVTAYVNWALSTRKVKNDTVRIDLARIAAALGRNPKYLSISGPWFPALLSCIPEDSEEELRRRKEEKYLSHDILRRVPEAIRRDCPVEGKADARTKALFFRDAFLLEWMLTLPWRQRNHREIRIGDRPNLFKARVPALASVSRPDWLVELEKTDPDVEVWQVRFSRDETKTKHTMHCVLPRRLAELLEEYLSEHRKHLVTGVDSGSLFLNNFGKGFNARTFGTLISGITLRYGGRSVSPHLFRDIYAFMWLKKMPEDYLTLSKLLWHKNIQTTIKKYGWMCNESSALCRAERVLGL